MPTLSDLPAEVLGVIAESLHKLDPLTRNLLNLTLTCRQVHAATIDHLNKRFIYHGQRDSLGQFLKRYYMSVRQLSRGKNLREIILQDWNWSRRTPCWSELDLATDSEVWGPDSLGSSLCRVATQLRKLTVDYPFNSKFLNFHSTTIHELSVRPIHGQPGYEPGGQVAIDFPIDGPLNVDFLPYVLKWPRLERLSVEGTLTYDSNSLYRCAESIQPRSSPITHLKLRLDDFESEAISILCSAPATLKSFTYIPPIRKDVASPQYDGSIPQQLPMNSEVAQSLLPHVKTLQSLALARAGSFWTEKLDRIESLQKFIAMTTLRIDATMLLGWNHCEHNKEDDMTDAFPPSVFGSLLPPLIRDLTVLIDWQEYQSEQREYIIALVKGITVEITTGRITQLKCLRLQASECKYCWPCLRDHIMPDLHLNRLSLQEADFFELFHKLAEVGCHLQID